MGNIFIGDSNSKAEKIINAYVGVDGLARKIKAIYVGVDNIARLVWSGARKVLSKYTSYSLGSKDLDWYVSYNNTNHSASLSNYNYKKSTKLQNGVLCDIVSIWTNNGTQYQVNSIQRFTIDNENNATKVERINYNYTTGWSNSDGSWDSSTSTQCDLYLELGNYLFTCLLDHTDGNTGNGRYCVYDWSGNQICSLQRNNKLGTWGNTLYMPQSGYALSDSKVVVGAGSFESVGVGIINFNGSSLTQKYYYPVFVDSKGVSHGISCIKTSHAVEVAQLDANTGIMICQGYVPDTDEAYSKGLFITAFRINNDDTITFGKLLYYLNASYIGDISTETNVLLVPDRNHAVLDISYTYSGSYSYYSKRWYTLYIDNNLNVSVTEMYDVYETTDRRFSSERKLTAAVIGNSLTIAIGNPVNYTDTSKRSGVYLYTLDTTTNKIVSLGGEVMPQSCTIPSSEKEPLERFCSFGDDKLIMFYYSSADPARAHVAKFE